MSLPTPEPATQPRQVHVHGALTTAVDLLPHLGEDLAFGHDLPHPAREHEQQVELTPGQVDGRGVERDDPTGRVDDEAPDRDPLVGVGRFAAAQHRAHPRLEPGRR